MHLPFVWSTLHISAVFQIVKIKHSGSNFFKHLITSISRMLTVVSPMITFISEVQTKNERAIQ